MRSARWRCCPAAATSCRARMTVHYGCGIWRRVRACASSKAIRVGSARSCCCPTVAAPSLAPGTKPAAMGSRHRQDSAHLQRAHRWGQRGSGAAQRPPRPLGFLGQTPSGCGTSRPVKPCASSKGTPVGPRGGGAGRRPPRPFRLGGPHTAAMGSRDRCDPANLRRAHQGIARGGRGGRRSRALSGAADNTLRLWDLASRGDLMHPRRAYRCGALRWRCWVTAAAPSPALGITPCGYGIWRGRETPRAPEAHTGVVVLAVTVLGDGNNALSVSDDHTLRLSDVATRQSPGASLKGTPVGSARVAVLSDGRRALSVSDDNTLRLWDLATGETLRILKGHALNWTRWRCCPTAAAPSPAPGTTPYGCGIWQAGRTLCTLEGHTDKVRAVVVLGDGSRALSGSDDKTLRLWDLESGETLRTLEGHTGARSPRWQ